MTIRTVVLTGPGSGLGLHAARLLLARTPATLVVLTRSAAAAAAVHSDLTPELAARVVPLVCDVSSLASVRSSALELSGRIRSGELAPIEAIVLNAAVLRRDAYAVSADGIELTMATNALGPHLLVALLSRDLATTARVVAVGSGEILPRWWQRLRPAHRPPVLPLEQQCRPHKNGRAAYASSKLALFFFCRALATVAPPGISISYFDPGLMPGTGIARDRNGLERAYWHHVLPYLAWLNGGRSIGRSADALARHLMIQNESFRGDYVGIGGVQRSDIDNADPGTVADYFRSANKICGVTADDTAPWWR
jgi:NAD(P)-dependent dehydrogenase (short-subunit alcohol dehydrogenase family)